MKSACRVPIRRAVGTSLLIIAFNAAAGFAGYVGQVALPMSLLLGFGAAAAIHDLCRASGVPVWCGGMLESGVGRAYNVALASLPGFTLPGDVSPSARYWERDVVRPEWTMDGEGMVEVPRSKPGIGVEVDRDRIEDLTVRAATVR